MNLEWPHVVHICVSMWECVCKREIETPRTSPSSLGKSKRKMGNINLIIPYKPSFNTMAAKIILPLRGASV